MAAQVLARFTGGPLDGGSDFVDPGAQGYDHQWEDEHGQGWVQRYMVVPNDPPAEGEEPSLAVHMKAEGEPEWED